MKKYKNKLIHFDIDGTLCKEECWTEKECLSATPIKKNIELCNKIFEEAGFLVIYTARRDFLMNATFRWLKENGVRFHAVSNQKNPTDFYFDDKTIKL